MIALLQGPLRCPSGAPKKAANSIDSPVNAYGRQKAAIFAQKILDQDFHFWLMD
jgi:hypothetical protein